MVLRYLGVQAVIAESFARIHAANLVNFGIVPLTFDDPRDLEVLEEGDTLSIEDIAGALVAGSAQLQLNVARLARPMGLRHQLSARQIAILLAGGLLHRAGGASIDPQPTLAHAGA